jgi:hypothetical protein
LVDQVTIGGMDLHAIEAGIARANGGAGIILHRRTDVFFGHCPWYDIRLLARRSLGVTLCGNRRRTDRCAAIQEIRM